MTQALRGIDGSALKSRAAGYASCGALTILLFILTGSPIQTPFLKHLGEAVFSLDNAVRIAAFVVGPPVGAVPVTLVEVDDATVAHWPFTEYTPRKELADVLAVVSSVAPAAIVVDIDLSDTAADAPERADSERQMRQFLQAYRGPAPIILVRRVSVAGNGGLRVVRNNLVRALAADANPAVSWAHALYVTDDDGTVRRWRESITACTDTGESETLPAVPVAVLARATWTRPAFERPAFASARAASCNADDAERSGHLVMFGPRLTGTNARFAPSSVQRVSAWELTDRNLQRDDTALFQGRVVVIGGTHERANDTWRTPLGYMPGVELVTNTVQFSAGQLRFDAAPTRVGLSPKDWWAVGVFVVFTVFLVALRKSLAVGVCLLVTAVVFRWLITGSGYYPALESVETSLLLLVQLGIFLEGMEILRQGIGRQWCRLFLNSSICAREKPKHASKTH